MHRMPEAVSSIESAGTILHLKPGTLSSFAAIVEQFPFPEGVTFGSIGKPERRIALGYTPTQLVGVLHRLDSESAKEKDARIFDKAHWQLAALEALQVMSGPLPKPVQDACDTQIALLREQVADQRGLRGILSPRIARRQIQEVPALHKNQTVVEKEIRNSLAEAFLNHAREFVRIQKNPRVILAELIASATAACSGIIFGGGPTRSAETATPPAITATVTEFPSPSATPAPTVTETQSPTPEPTPTVTATKEPEIGGTASVVLWRNYGEPDIPPEFAPYLVPTSPEQWKILDTLTMSDGKPIPWGGAITYVNVNVNVNDPAENWPMVPGLVRGAVQFGVNPYDGLPQYGEVIEFPVKGGSVFYIAGLRDGTKSRYLQTSQLIPGAYPVECTGGVICPLAQVYDRAVSESSIISEPGMVSLLRRIQGKMALFMIRPDPIWQVLLDAIAHGSLATGEAHGGLLIPEIWWQP